MLRIPFNPSISADQTFRVLIPERMVISLRLTWNTRDSSWYMTISTDRGEIGALKVVGQWPLLFSHKGLSPIDGDIIVFPLSDGNGKPLREYDALGDSWGLFWLDEDDLADWEASNDMG